MMTSKTQFLEKVAVVILAMLLFIPTALVSADTPPHPAYGTRVVDGDYSEWYLSLDFFAEMYRAANPRKNVESKLYLRYDCSTSTLYALVLAVTDVSVVVDVYPTEPDEAFIKINGSKVVDGNSGDDGTPPDFEWVGRSGDGHYAEGWEASASLAEGSYTLDVHTNVFDDGEQQTSAVANRAISLTISCPTMDLGDLPASYQNTTLANDGARHIVGNLYLGNAVDADGDGQESDDTTGDDMYDGTDDEDGVVRTSGVKWSVGSPPNNGGSVDVTVNGCSGTCYLNGWINWNTGTDTDFNDTGEQIFTDRAITTNGTQTLTFSIPAGVMFPNTFDARFRLCSASGMCNTVTGEASDGEVEDYQWDFGPNAVVLTELEARPISQDGWAMAPIAVGLLTIGTVGLIALTRRRKDSAIR